MVWAYICVVRGWRHKGSSCRIVPLVFPSRRGQHVPRVSEKPTIHTVSLSLSLSCVHSPLWSHSTAERHTRHVWSPEREREREREREGGREGERERKETDMHDRPTEWVMGNENGEREKRQSDESNGEVAGKRRLEMGRQTLTGTQQGANT